MTHSTWVWMIVFALATLVFFGAAAIITVVGIRDLNDLLKGPHRHASRKEPDPHPDVKDANP